MLVDTHTHLYLPEFDADRETVMQRAFDTGVKKILLPNIDSTTNKALFDLIERYPKNCFAMIGLHPCSVKENWEDELDNCRSYLFDSDRNKFYGIGEIGLDYYWDKTFITQQQESLCIQLKRAKELNLPVSIHSREAVDDCIEIVSVEKNNNLNGVFHCFSGTLEQALKITSLGFYLGIGGVVTFKNSGLDKILPNIPLEHVVLETDAPYLAPVPHRGKRNESSYLNLVVQKIAEIKSTTVEEVERITTANALKIFAV
jgi:TatD DNase family protein